MASADRQVTDRSSGLHGIDQVIFSWLSSNPEILGRIRQRAIRRAKMRKVKSVVYLTLLILVSVGFVLGTGAVDTHCGISLPSKQTPANRVALVDPLSLYYPNPDFTQKVSALAARAGFQFDYYSPNLANLDFLTHLPEMGYKIIILRTHGASGQPILTTSIPYNPTQRIGDQLMDRLGSVRVQGHEYFALLPDFVSGVMCGRFQGTLILAMGCNALGLGGGLAGAFIQKGAGAFVGWTSLVTITHTDPTFEALIALLLRGYPIADAVQMVEDRYGPDLQTGAHLAFATA